LKWKTLRHNGVAFPPPHDYCGLVIQIRDERVKLDPRQEEMLLAWAKKKDTPYVQDPVFQKNFTEDLRKILPARFADISLSDIDWTELHAIAEREKTANLSPEEKKKRSAERKATREELKARFGTAIIDGIETEVGAYLVEPPGILMGRGNHPLRGKWKERVEPEEVTLNLDEDAPAPPAPDGHRWGKIVHDHDSMWIATWYDKLSEKRKYVWLADSSHLRQERDKEKYVKAQKLESGLGRVRAEILKGMNYEETRSRASLEKQERAARGEIKSLEARSLEAAQAGDQETRRKLEDELRRAQKELERFEKRRQQIHAAEMKKRQIATTCYLIDRLAMRVGDEKDEDEADTVGASTLRVEHVRIGKDAIAFDFLGKDSVRWEKSLPLDGSDQVLARNLQDFIAGKSPGDQIFDKIDSTHVNRFLSSIVPGLTAKVFRTYHATTTVRDALLKQRVSEDASTFAKEYAAKLANLEAAVMCNHKRTPPKNWEENLAKKEQALEGLRAARPNLDRLRAQIARREAALRRLLEQQKKFQEDAPRRIQQREDALKKLRARKEPKVKKDAAKLARRIKTAEKALAQAQKEFAQKTKRFAERIARAQDALRKAKDAPQKAQRDYAERVEKARLQLELAKMTRDYNLGTSLKNYIDPRVYKSWGDSVGFDWKRLYTKALQRKFAWAEKERVNSRIWSRIC
jgi:DNA topoisomerase-1